MRVLVSLFFALSLCAQAETNQSHSFFQDALTIQLSSDLKQLTPSAIKKRYGKQNMPPEYAFSNKDKNVSFTFTRYPTPADKKSMKKIHKSLSNMLRKSAGKASWKKDKVYTRLGTRIAVYEYEVKAVGKYQYNLTYALPVEGKLTFVSFTTTEKKYKTKWLTLARENFDSISLTN